MSSIFASSFDIGKNYNTNQLINKFMPLPMTFGKDIVSLGFMY